MTDRVVAETDCPACGVRAGKRCQTVIDGHDTGWTHDARFYKHSGFANADA